MSGDVGATLRSIRHDYSSFNWVFSGGDTLVGENSSAKPETGSCDMVVPEIERQAGAERVRDRQLAIPPLLIYISTPTTPPDAERYPSSRKRAAAV